MNRPYKLHSAPPITLEIKYGMKMMGKGGKPYPTKLNHFLIVTREKGELNYEIAKDVHDELGDTKPQSIPICLLSDDPSENFTLFRGMFSAQGILGCGAIYGENKAQRRFRGSGKEFEMCDPYEVECSASCTHWQSEKCDISGILYFRLSEGLPRSSALGACRINGTNAQRRVRASLEIIRNQTGGFLANLPLKLTIHQEPKRTLAGDTYKVPMLSIEPACSQQEFFKALEVELERRRRLNALLGYDEDHPLEIKGILTDVTSRAAIEDSIEVNDLPADSVSEISGPLFIIPDDVSTAFSDMPQRKVEMIMSQFSDKSGVPDIEKIRDYLSKEEDRKKKAPSLNDDINF